MDEIERRFEEYIHAELSVDGLYGISDPRIHACLYFIAPLSGSLRKMDVEFMKAVHKRVNLIPIISKADTFTAEELECAKAKVIF